MTKKKRNIRIWRGKRVKGRTNEESNKPHGEDLYFITMFVHPSITWSSRCTPFIFSYVSPLPLTVCAEEQTILIFSVLQNVTLFRYRITAVWWVCGPLNAYQRRFILGNVVFLIADTNCNQASLNIHDFHQQDHKLYSPELNATTGPPVALLTIWAALNVPRLSAFRTFTIFTFNSKIRSWTTLKS
jgi:hypothetical protein